MIKECGKSIDNKVSKIAYRQNFVLLESFERTGKLEGEWNVDKDKWDALIFEAKKDIRVFGIGIHGPKDD